MRKQSKAEGAAERYASKMHSLDTSHFHFAVANFRAGAAWQKRQDVAALKKAKPSRMLSEGAVEILKKAGSK